MSVHYPPVRTEVGLKDGGYIHHLILCNGPLFKKSSNHTSGTGMSNLQFRKRFFELSNQALSYSQSEKKSGVSDMGNPFSLPPSLSSPSPSSLWHVDEMCVGCREAYVVDVEKMDNISSSIFSPPYTSQEIKSYPVQWIKVVEKLDEGAFHRKHMFQVVLVPSGPSAQDQPGQITLYLQASVSRPSLTAGV